MLNTVKLNEIIGKKVLSIRGIKTKIDKRIKKEYIEPHYILFDDGKTILRLEEQDYYCYHDCSSDARLLYLDTDEEFYNNVLNDLEHFPIANMDI